MDVSKSFRIDSRHSVEIGSSTWDDRARSLRNRYDQEDGKFDRVSSQEIPVSDLELLFGIAIENGLLTKESMVSLGKKLLDAVAAPPVMPQ